MNTLFCTPYPSFDFGGEGRSLIDGFVAVTVTVPSSLLDHDLSESTIVHYSVVVPGFLTFLSVHPDGKSVTASPRQVLVLNSHNLKPGKPPKCFGSDITILCLNVRSWPPFRRVRTGTHTTMTTAMSWPLALSARSRSMCNVHSKYSVVIIANRHKRSLRAPNGLRVQCRVYATGVRGTTIPLLHWYSGLGLVS